MTSQILQVIAGATEGDAITGMALEIQRSLSAKFSVHTYAHHVDESISTSDVELLTDVASRGDLIIYHASYGVPSITKFLLTRDEPIVLIYHNITPAHFLADSNPEFATGLVWGRFELTMLLPRVVLAIADSEFNAEDLTQAGYERPIVLKLGLNPHRLSDVAVDDDLAKRLETQYPSGYVVAVSQILPHKAVDELVQVAHVLRRWCSSEVGLVVVGVARDEKYLRGVVSLLTSMPEVNLWLFGKATDSELKTLYCNAVAYIGISRHEGLSLPILEAMAEGVPVLVRNAGAVEETSAGGAFLLSEDANQIEIAEGLAMLIESEHLRQSLITRGQRVLEQLTTEEELTRFVQMIESLLA